MVDKLVVDNLPKFAFITQRPGDAVIFTDVDGTVIEIAARPELVKLSPAMKDALAKLSKTYQVIAVSGRPAGEVKKLLAVPNLIYLGNHGLERWDENGLSYREDTKALAPGIEEAAAAARKLSQESPGVSWENKGGAVAVHYRRSQDPKISKKIEAALAPVARRRSLRLLHGRKVVEIKSANSDKGIAVATLIKETGRRRVLYLGDDRTDVDGFKRLRLMRRRGEVEGYALAVLSSETPAVVKKSADYFFKSISEVAYFFNWLANEGKN